MKIGSILSYEKERAAPVQAAGITVTPELARLQLRLPWGLAVWARPVAVLIDSGAGTERIPIIDVMRWLQLALWLPPVLYGAARLVRRARRAPS